MSRNWFVENDVTPPLGLAYMMLSGAIDGLQFSVENKRLDQIHADRVFLNKLIPLYERAKLEADKNLLITKDYLFLGEVALKESDTMLRTASSLLRSSLKSANLK